MVKDKLAEILNFFEPVQLNGFEDSSYLCDDLSVGNQLLVNAAAKPVLPDARFELALIFIGNPLNEQQNISATQTIREEFYKLKRVSSGLRIADLGNLKQAKNLNETIFGLQEVCVLLFHLKVNVVIVGGPQMLSLGKFRAFKEFENNINLVCVDSKIRIASKAESFNESDILSNLIEKEASHIYNIANVGYQSYFVDAKQLKQINELYFEHYRLGEVRAKFEHIEPVFRDADLVSFDISSVRLSEAPAQIDGSPNGFYADEACRISRYAGISDRVQAFGIYGIEAKLDQNRQTSKLAAQIIWYYFEGYLNRKHDFPKTSLNNYTKYEVQIDEIDFPIVFYKSNKSGRWWLKAKAIDSQYDNAESVVVSCTEEDYLKASKNEIPDRWWLNFKKLK